MEAERDVVRDPGTSDLAERRGVQDEWVRYWSTLAADSDDNGDPAA